MTTKRTQVAEINLQPNQAQDYSAYVPIRLGNLITAAFIDSGNTFANVISPQTMTALGIIHPPTGTSTSAFPRNRRRREEDEGVGTGAPKRPPTRPTSSQVSHLPSRAPGPGAPPLTYAAPSSPGRASTRSTQRGFCESAGKTFRCVRLANPGVHPNCHLPDPRRASALYTFLRHQHHANSTPPVAHLRKPIWVMTLLRSRESCELFCPSKSAPHLPAGTLVLLQIAVASLLGDNSILQEIRPYGSLSVLADNWEATELELAPSTLVGLVQEVTEGPSDVDSETSPPPEATTHAEFDALPQSCEDQVIGSQLLARLLTTTPKGLPSLERSHPGSCSSSPTSFPLEGTERQT